MSEIQHPTLREAHSLNMKLPFYLRYFDGERLMIPESLIKGFDKDNNLYEEAHDHEFATEISTTYKKYRVNEEFGEFGLIPKGVNNLEYTYWRVYLTNGIQYRSAYFSTSNPVFIREHINNLKGLPNPHQWAVIHSMELNKEQFDYCMEMDNDNSLN